MNKKKITTIIVAVLCMVAIGFGGVKYFRYAKAKDESRAVISLKLNEAVSLLDIGTESDPIILEYGSDFDFGSKIENIRAHQPNVVIGYSVNGNNYDRNVDTKNIGVYDVNVIFSVTDSYNQVLTKDIHTYYSVFDTQEPLIKFYDDETEKTVYEDSNFEAIEVLEYVSDPVDGNLKESDTLEKGTYTVTTNFKNEVIGDYTLTVEAMDKNGLTSKADFAISVIERPKAKTVTAGGNGGSVSISNPDPNRIYLGSYTAVLYFGDDQAIADAADSANYYPTDAGTTAIADHNYQGFYSAMVNNSTGYAFGKPIHKVSTHYGYLSADGWDIMFNDGGSYSTVADGAICMYTCIDNNGGRIITFWNYD